MKAHRSGLFGLLAALAIWVPGMASLHAAAADIVVTSATPSSAEQGTQGLLVTIKGSGFPKNATVRYCKTGSVPEDCSGINVNSTRIKGTTSIETVIDVAPADAAETKFDILVIEPLSGRKGRGTQLFKVIKTNTPASQPPDPVVIGQADPIETAISIAWPVPLDPDPSDTVVAFDIRFGTSPITATNFDVAAPVPEGLLNAGPVGSINTLSIRDLQPGITYYIAVRAISNKGEVSDLGPSSVVTVETLPTYPTSHAPTWVSETVESIVEYPEGGSPFGTCCRLERLDFDASGNAGIIYQVPGSDQVAPAVRYATSTLTGWARENALNGSVNGISDLRYAPGSSGAGLDAGAPSLLATQTVKVLVRKNQYTNQRLRSFLFRTAAGTWTSETVPFAVFDEPELEYFSEDAGETWKPATVLTEQVTLPDSSTVPKLSLISRKTSGASAQWIKDIALDCTAFPGTVAGEAAMLRGEADGELDVIVSLTKSSGTWVLVAHRGSGATWTYRRTGLFPSAQVQGVMGRGAYAMDDSGQLYAVAAVSPNAGMNDLVLFEGMQLNVMQGQAPCSVPQVAWVGTRTVIDHGESADIYAPWNPDGSIVGTLPYLDGISGFALEYLNGAEHPAIHVMYERDDAWHRIREQRVLSRCGGPGSEWYRDAVDRAYGDTESRAVFSYGPDFGIAWAHHVGRHDRQTSFTTYEERMLYTHRVGSVCSAP